MKLGYFLEKKLKNNLISVTFPEDIGVTFSSIYGLEKEIEVLKDIVNYLSNGSTTNVKPHSSYLVSGPIGIGKSSLMYALAKEAQIPIITIDCSVFRVNSINETKKTLALIFDTARKLRKYNGGTIISFNNAHEIELMNEDSVIFYSYLMKNLYDIDNIFMFMLSIKEILTVPAVIIDNDLFTTSLSLDYPKFEVREKIIEDYLNNADIQLASDVSIQRLAKDTLGETPQSIAYIVKETLLYSLRQNHEVVTQNDFSETIMRISAGENKFRMTEKDRQVIAYHEAGHVIAGYFSNPDEYTLSRVEITPRSQSLGITCDDIDENKNSYFKKDYENLIIIYLGGMCAEELIFNEHTSAVSDDLLKATGIASNMVKVFGMNDNFGPIVVVKEYTDSPNLRDFANSEAQKIMKELSQETKNILSSHKAYLDALAAALLEKEVVLGNEIEEIFNAVDTTTATTEATD